MSLKNGHDAPKRISSQSQSAIRSRLFRERRKRGAVILRAEIEATMIEALISCGWLHSLERDSRAAVTSAIGALVLRSLQSGVTPSNKPLIEIDLEAVRDAWTWARPGSQPTAENAAKALSNVARCSALVGFGPSEFGERLKVMADI